MSLATRIASTALTAVAAGALFSAAAAPAFASDAKPVTITMPAAALVNPDAKLCMPRTVIDKSKHSDLPKTVCQTRDEWAAQGVTIVAKK